MNELNKLPYAQWLEETLHNIVGMPVESICIMAKFDTGDVGSSYYNCSVADKVMFAGFVQQDAMIETLKVNGLVPDDEGEYEEDESNNG